jgi:SprA-related family
MINISSIYNAQINRQFSGTPDDSSGIPLSNESPPINGQGSLQGKDQIAISDRGKQLSAKSSTPTKEKTGTSTQTSNQKKKAQNAQDLAEIQQLKQRDAHVRAHELAHLAVAGQYATGGPSYTYQTGPDGVRYAVGGEVPIDISSESTPEATIRKMETVRKAALAPVDPSAADRQIAAEASAKELQAIQELQTEQREKASAKRSDVSASDQKSGSSAPFSSSEKSPAASDRLSSGNSRQIMIKAYQNMLSLA